MLNLFLGILSVITAFFGLAVVFSLFHPDMGGEITAAFAVIEVICLLVFLPALKKYRSPEHQEKMKKAQEATQQYRDEAPQRRAIERARWENRERIRRQRQAQREEAKRQAKIQAYEESEQELRELFGEENVW